MTWFGRIVNEAFQRQWVPREKKESQNGDSVGYIPHDNTAFRPGDEVLYTLNTGKGVVDVYGTVVSNNDGNSITIKRNGSEKTTTRSMWSEEGVGHYNKHLQHCKSWLKPVKDSGNWKFTAEVYEVGYETSKDLTVQVSNKSDSIVNNFETTTETVTDNNGGDKAITYAKIPDGIDLIVIKDKRQGKKSYYKWPNGEYFGFINTTKENLGNTIWLPKKDSSEPAKVYKGKFNPSFYVFIPEEYSESMVFENDKFVGWNFKYCFYLLEKCPWLQTMKVNWYIPKDGRVLKNYCILDNPQVKAKWETLQ